MRMRTIPKRYFALFMRNFLDSLSASATYNNPKAHFGKLEIIFHYFNWCKLCLEILARTHGYRTNYDLMRLWHGMSEQQFSVPSSTYFVLCWLLSFRYSVNRMPAILVVIRNIFISTICHSKCDISHPIKVNEEKRTVRRRRRQYEHIVRNRNCEEENVSHSKCVQSVC